MAQLSEHPSVNIFTRKRRTGVKSPQIRSLTQLGSGSCAWKRAQMMWVLSNVTGQKLPIRKTTVDLLKPCSRLLDLLDAPEDIPFLSGLVQREIVYRLLRGPQGARLRAIATLGDESHRTAKAIAWLRANYAKRLASRSTNNGPRCFLI